MICLNPDFYDDLAQELITQIIDNESDEGVVEIAVGPNTHVIFAFSEVDYTLERGLNSLSYLVLGFQGGRREATDFCAAILDGKITG